MSYQHLVVFALLALCVIVSGCASEAALRGTPADYREEVTRLKQTLRRAPNDTTARRDLGAIYVRTGRPENGYKQLEKVYQAGLDDPKTLFYLGVAREKTGRTDAALQLYEQYTKVSEDSPYRSLLQGRYESLQRMRARRAIAQKLDREEERADTEVSPSTVAVLPLAYRGDNERFAPLSRGLSEMISTDLATVDRLTVVERVRLQALLDEIELSQSNLVDPSTAPRAGQIVGAGRLVGGGFAVQEDETVNVDVALARLRRDTAQADVASQSNALDRLFELEREIVFGVLRRLGIEPDDLTAETRAEIERAPTQDLQAFLAFSRGLLEEDAGNYGAAAEAYQQAQQRDPSFQDAARREQQAESLSAAGGSPDDALAAAGRIDPPPSSIDVVNRQLRTLGRTTGGGFQRDPAAEEQIGESLNDPPAPPPVEGGS
jgi:tetratricopeptide (TPR) repeat protein